MSFSIERGFNGKIFDCIDRALDTLGEGVKQSLYYQIENRFHIPRDEFASRSPEIIDHLKQILDIGGSSMLERLIVREIRKEFKLDYQKDLPLASVIQEARSKFLNAHL